MNGFSLGRIFGIQIRVDWSWLLILSLVTWSFGSYFDQLNPEWPALTSWIVGLAGAILFFLSVLAHELAHSLMARKRGLPVTNITLFLFGGVANIQKEPTSPVTELLVTIVGPLTSFILGALFLVLAVGEIVFENLAAPAAGISSLAPLNALFFMLGSANILLGFFNLIPGFPLDGGRILRSLIWAATGNEALATRWAALVGQAVAWSLILAGVAMLFGVRIPFLGSGMFNGLWTIFIGWFLQRAAAQSYRKVAIQGALEGVPVKTLMNPDVPSAPAGITVESLVDEHIMRSDNRAFIVFDEGRMVGLVTMDDVRKLTPEQRETKTVREIMTPSEKLVVVAPDEKASDALARLEHQDIRQLPVVYGSNIVGMVRRKDILRWLELQSREENV